MYMYLYMYFWIFFNFYFHFNPFHSLISQISSMSSQLDLSHQPQKYLVETLQSRDKEMEAIRNRNWALEARTRELEKERNHLMETKNQLSLDLERLLNHNEVGGADN